MSDFLLQIAFYTEHAIGQAQEVAGESRRVRCDVSEFYTPFYSLVQKRFAGHSVSRQVL